MKVTALSFKPSCLNGQRSFQLPSHLPCLRLLLPSPPSSPPSSIPLFFYVNACELECLEPHQDAAVNWHSVLFVYSIYLSWPPSFTVCFSPPASLFLSCLPVSLHFLCPVLSPRQQPDGLCPWNSLISSNRTGKALAPCWGRIVGWCRDWTWDLLALAALCWEVSDQNVSRTLYWKNRNFLIHYKHTYSLLQGWLVVSSPVCDICSEYKIWRASGLVLFLVKFLRILFMLDKSAAHSLCPVPMFSTNARK